MQTACVAPQAALLRPCSSGRRGAPATFLSSSAPAALRSSSSSGSSLRAARRTRASASAGGGDEATASGLAAINELDLLIDQLLQKKSPQELAQTVAENIMSFDQRFWLRLATRSDAAPEEEDKRQLADLAKVGGCGGWVGAMGGQASGQVLA
jgi:hypothetical protein